MTIALVNTAGSGWHEQHAWSFHVLPAMRYDKVAGKGWVQASKSQLHRYGIVDLTSWSKATLTNSPDALTVHPDVGKALVAHDGGGATVDQITVGPAPSPSPSPSESASPSPSPSASATPAP